MIKYMARCIFNHTLTTRRKKKLDRWLEKHEHPEVIDVVYDEEGRIKSIITYTGK